MKTHLILKFCAVLLLCAALPAGAEQTYAERLGWGPEDRVLIINSDDIGMSLATNLATIESLEFGLVSSVSIMMTTPWVPHFVAYLEENPDVCAGLHLALTSEWVPYRWGPVAGKPAVPSLVDQQGALFRNNDLLYASGTPDDVEREIRAQIDRAETLGLEITHIDTHMGSLRRNPEYFDRWLKVGIEKQLPMRVWAELDRSEELWEGGLPVLDHIHSDSYNWKTRDKAEHYKQAFRELQPGLTEMIVHPTKPNEVIDVITNNRELLYGDYFALTDPEVKQVLEEEGIILTTWREVKERRERVAAAESQEN